MDFPITDLMDEEACYATLVAWLHPSGLACPHCHRGDRMMIHRCHRAPVLDFRVRPLWPGLQHLHRHDPTRHPAPAQRTGPDRPRDRPRCPDRPTGPRVGLRPLGTLEPATSPARPGLPPSGPDAVGGQGRGGRRGIPECGGKKACRIPIPTTRRDAGRTRRSAMVVGRTIARRSAEWWDVTAARSG